MDGIAVVNSADAPGQLSVSEFLSCLLQLASIMNVRDKPIPQILVLHVSDEIATVFGVGSSGVIRHNRSTSFDPHDYYEVWLVGTPDVANYLVPLLAILEDCYSLDLSSQDRQQALDSILWTTAGYDINTVQ